VTVSGTVTYDFVPVEFVGLDYARTEARPARLVTVQFLVDGAVVATARTDRSGHYALEVEANQSGMIRVLAETREPLPAPAWLFRAVDNVSGDAIYTLDGSVASVGTADSERDLHAPSGWTGSDYGGERAAAPFAILDTILVGADQVLAAAPETIFPDLDIHWSPANVNTTNADGDPDPDTGEIGTSRYAVNTALGMNGIYLLGAEDSDTEEYDRHVILHEFAHYLARELGRSDSIGGPHAVGDALDPRVAFSEGWATAFAAIALDDPFYLDSIGSGQRFVFPIDIEGGFDASAGWFRERSVFQLVYDLVDLANELDVADAFSYPFADVWSVMTGEMVSTRALTTIFVLLDALKNARPADAILLDDFAARYGMAPVTSDFGEGETNDAGSADVLPLYTPLTVNGPAINLCSTDEFTSPSSGATNKLGSRRFVRFTPPLQDDVTITVTATSIPAGQYADPDFELFLRRQIAIAPGAPTNACKAVDDPAWTPESCVETLLLPLAAAEHVLEIYEWTNTEALDSEFPPIGRTCFNVTVTQP